MNILFNSFLLKWKKKKGRKKEGRKLIGVDKKKGRRKGKEKECGEREL